MAGTSKSCTDNTDDDDTLEPIRLGAVFVDAGDGIGVKIANGAAGEAVLSRANVWALAGNVMIETAGGPVLEYKIGRVDADTCVG